MTRSTDLNRPVARPGEEVRPPPYLLARVQRAPEGEGEDLTDAKRPPCRAQGGLSEGGSVASGPDPDAYRLKWGAPCRHGARSGATAFYRGRLPRVTFKAISLPARTTSILTVSPGEVLSAR